MPAKYYLLFLFVLSLGCTHTDIKDSTKVNHTRNTPIFISETEEYKIYSDLINKKYIRDSVGFIVIYNSTSVHKGGFDRLERTIEFISERLPGGLPQEIRDDFLAKNRQAYPLKDSFELRVPYALISEKDLREVFQKEEGWDAFYRKYPRSQGGLSLSRVGFNRKNDQALVYIGNQTSETSGGGYYILLIKENGAWTIKKELSAWVI